MRLVDRDDGPSFPSALDESAVHAAGERGAARWETIMLTRISTKLIVGVGSVALIIIGIFAYGILSAHQQQLISEVRRSAYQLSETVKNSTHYDMLLNQRESVHRMINTIGKQDGIKKVRIFNKDGAIIYSTDPRDAGRMVDKRGEECYACHVVNQPLERLSIAERTRIFQLPGSGRILGIINPIYNEPSCWQGNCHAHEPTQKVLGVLDISMSLDDVDRDMESSQRRLILLGIVAIGAVSLMIYCLVNRIVLTPVTKIAAATRKVAAGDLHHQIVLANRDEIGTLAESFNDMTRKLSEAQRQIYQSEKLAAVGQLAAGVAHEINNPLTGVLSYASFLLKRAENKPEFKEDLAVIVRETKRCRQIVKGLLDFARQMPPEKQLCDLTEIVERAVQIVQAQLVTHRVELRKELRTDLPRVSVDANQIQQVLVNLLLNAADAIGDGGGTITLATDYVQPEAERTDRLREVEVRVIDTGCGIAPENIERIFDPFFSTKGRKGTGLGLAVVWGIIEKHNGRIEVQSVVGKGTTFHVVLPILAE
jgi:two-component system, NtrC family, sensor kinase